jgi:hypothetical protein
MINKWTIGLAAAGAVSWASAARGEEAPSPLSSLSSTVLSGYVDTSAQWNLGDGVSHAPAYKYGGASRADGFNLDVIKLTIERPLDESQFAAGYKVDLFFGPDAEVLATKSTAAAASDFAVKQAYVVLRAPVGNGLDFKVGVFDSVIGYESTEATENPNFTRSWGHTFEPSEHTGVLASYHVNEHVAFSAGVADTLSPQINGRSGSGFPLAGQNESYKTYMASTSLTAPSDWKFIADSAFFAGIVSGWNGGIAPGASQQNYYLGATLNTPVSGLRVGGSFDYAKTDKTLTAVAGVAGTPFPSFEAHSFAGYMSYQVFDKLSLHGRLEYADITPLAASLAQGAGIGLPSSVLSTTATAQYDLWKNVLSRVELRWDHALDGTDAFGGTTPMHIQSGHTVTGSQQDSFIIAANLIYKF